MAKSHAEMVSRDEQRDRENQDRCLRKNEAEKKGKDYPTGRLNIGYAEALVKGYIVGNRLDIWMTNDSRDYGLGQSRLVEIN